MHRPAKVSQAGKVGIAGQNQVFGQEGTAFDGREGELLD
jgi:hypothetical protein